MTLRAQYGRSHPEFPWLDAGDSASISEFLLQRGWLEPGERVLRCEKAGEGNMNLTLRVATDRRSLILKQARPWVEKYDHIAAPWERMTYERRFYERVAAIPEVAARMPRLLAFDEPARAILLEDLPDAEDLTPLYSGQSISEADLRELAEFLRALHAGTAGDPDPDFANRAMRALNHEHIFSVPLQADNGLDLDRFEPGLQAAAGELKQDASYRRAVEAVGRRYLADGRCLVHGDYFPGSWLRTRIGLRVIDAEFCFHGDAEFDLGVGVAHLALARQPLGSARAFLAGYARGSDAAWVARFAAVEVMRRLIGVAQLPIPASDGFRAALLRRARAALLDDDLEALWT